MKQKHREQKLKRKNFLPTLFITIMLWVLLGGLVYFVDPSVFLAIPAFFAAVFFVILFSFSLLFASSRRGFLSAMSVAGFLVLSYLGVGNIINFLLIVAIAVCVEIYLSR